MKFPKKALDRLIRFLGLALLAVILLRIDLPRVLSAMGRVRVPAVLAVLAAAFLINALKGFRLYWLLGVFDRYYNLGDCILTTFVGNYLGSVTPGRVGELVQGYYLRRDADIPLALSIPLLLYTRVFDFYVVAVVAAAGIIRYHAVFIPAWLKWLSAAGIVLVTGFIFIPRFFLGVLHLVRRKLPDRWGSGAQEPGFQLSLANVAVLMLITLGIYVFLFGRGIALSQGMGLELSPAKVIFFIAVVNILAYVPVSVAGLGTTQMALIFFLSREGISPEDAVAYSFLLFAAIYVWGVILGALAWLWKPIRLRSSPGEGS